MKKYIVLSVNDNPEYLFYLPLTVWAWRKFGWEPIIFYDGGLITEYIELFGKTFDKIHEGMTAEMKSLYSLKVYGNLTLGLGPYRSETVTQISRLYAACVVEGYLMTGDIDMIPLSDYWKFDENVITIWGHDLTGFQHIPICYIGMPATKWVEVMALTSGNYNMLIKRDLDSMPNASCDDPVKRWVVDQDLITERINKTEFIVNSVPRGSLANGYPVGRVDRSAWSLDHPQFIDAHLMRGIYKDSGALLMTMDLLHKVWPEEDFSWFEKYTQEFKQLVNG